MKCSAILLAAGYSSRMGLIKGLLPWKGKTILEHQLSEISLSRITETIVVLGWSGELLLPYIEGYKAKVVWNHHPEKGKSESIKLGIKEVSRESDGLFLLNIDQPVSHLVLNRMMEYLQLVKKSIVIPVYRDRRGHPILFSTSKLTELKEIKEETHGLKEIIRRKDADIAHLSIECPSVLWNFNTPEEYRGSYKGDFNRVDE